METIDVCRACMGDIPCAGDCRHGLKTALDWLARRNRCGQDDVAQAHTEYLNALNSPVEDPESTELYRERWMAQRALRVQMRILTACSGAEHAPTTDAAWKKRVATLKRRYNVAARYVAAAAEGIDADW